MYSSKSQRVVGQNNRIYVCATTFITYCDYYHYIGTVQILFRFNFLPSVADHRCERKKKIYSFFPQNIASSLLSAMDRTHDPCKDFFQYACGTWNKKHVIPEDRSSISTFEVRVCLLNKLKKIENHYAAIRCWPINNRPF